MRGKKNGPYKLANIGAMPSDPGEKSQGELQKLVANAFSEGVKHALSPRYRDLMYGAVMSRNVKMREALEAVRNTLRLSQTHEVALTADLKDAMVKLITGALDEGVKGGAS